MSVSPGLCGGACSVDDELAESSSIGIGSHEFDACDSAGLVEYSVDPELVECSVDPELVECSVDPELVECSVDPELVECSR